MTRLRRFQYGSVSKRGKRHKVWIGRWREQEANSDGTIREVRRAEVLGTIEEIPSKRDAERLLSERLQSQNVGTRRPSGTMTLRRYVEDSWKPAVFPSVKLSTRLFYTTNLNAHILPAFGDVPLRLITRDAVQRFLQAKAKAGLAWTSVKHLRVTLGIILKAAEMDDLIQQNVVRKTRLPRRTFTEEAKTVSIEELRSLLSALPEPSQSIATILVLTGLRIGEITALRWMDVDLANRTLRVRQTVYNGVIDTPKTKRSNRCVPLSPLAVERFRRQRQGSGTELIFASRVGKPLCRNNLIKRQLKPVAEKLKIDRMNWHWFRHAAASLLDASGASLGTVSTLLGHSSSQVTREYYMHDVPSESRNAVERLEQILIGPKFSESGSRFDRENTADSLIQNETDFEWTQVDSSFDGSEKSGAVIH